MYASPRSDYPLHTDTHCNALQCTATHCNALQHSATHAAIASPPLHSHTQPHTATHCNALHRTARHCKTLQHMPQSYCPLRAATLILPPIFANWRHTLRSLDFCNTQQHTVTHNALQRTAAYCSTLQYTAAYCSILQYTAAYCSTL